MDGAGGLMPPAPSVVSYRHAGWGDRLMEADSLLRWLLAGVGRRLKPALCGRRPQSLLK